MQSLFKNEKIDEGERELIIERVKGRSTRETEKILGEYSSTKKRDKKILLQEELLKKIERIQDEFGGLSEIEVIESLVDKHLEAKKRERSYRKSGESEDVRYIPRKLREEVDLRAGGRCEYISSAGVRCNCRTHLVYEHTFPVALGGKSEIGNLKKFCFTHNQRAAIEVFGEELINSRGRPR